jgi:hypothetical protein
LLPPESGCSEVGELQHDVRADPVDRAEAPDLFPQIQEEVGMFFPVAATSRLA